MQLKYWPVLPIVMFCLLQAKPVIAQKAGIYGQNQRVFTVAGLRLGMDYQTASKKYPKAKLDRQVANCYINGHSIRLVKLTLKTLRLYSGDGQLTLNFDSPLNGGRLSRILFDRPIDPELFDFRGLRDQLFKSYGHGYKKLYRRKMEPGGRIAGYQWQRVTGATLRVELRKEFRSDGQNLRLSYLAILPHKTNYSMPQRKLCSKP